MDDPQLTHGGMLATKYMSRVPEAEMRVLRLMLDFIMDRGLPIDGLLINGGYVRDLLRGVPPDDLDLSVCLGAYPCNTVARACISRVGPGACSMSCYLA